MISLTRKQVREVDRIAIEEYGIPGIILMENAAISIVNAIGDLLGKPGENQIGIVCGPGNNGGDGLAVARHLRNRGHRVSVVLAAPPEKYKADAATNLRIIQKMGGDCEYVEPTKDAKNFPVLRGCQVLIDAMFGTGLSRPLDEQWGGYVEAFNGHDGETIAIDVPSGLDCDSGLPLGNLCVRATRTITLAAEKVGFSDPASIEWTGQVIVGDIGCPPEILARVG